MTYLKTYKLNNLIQIPVKYINKYGSMYAEVEKWRA